MGKIVVKIVTAYGGARAAGGLADYNMLRRLKLDVLKDSEVTGETGGVLGIRQGEDGRVVACRQAGKGPGGLATSGQRCLQGRRRESRARHPIPGVSCRAPRHRRSPSACVEG